MEGRNQLVKVEFVTQAVDAHVQQPQDQACEGQLEGKTGSGTEPGSHLGIDQHGVRRFGSH